MSLTILAFMLMGYQNQIDAMIPWRANKVYAFSGNYYYRYDTVSNRVDPGYPKPIQGNWPGLGFTYVDAAVNYGNGKAFFFSGQYYTRYDIATDRADPGYPKLIGPAWNLPWNKVDGAVNRGGGKIYFFNNTSQTYVRYTVGASYPDQGYPQYTKTKWPAIPFNGIGAAACYGDRIYITYGNQYVRLWPSNGSLEQRAYNISYLPNAIPGTRITGPAANTYRPPPATRPPAASPPRNTYTPPASAGGKCKINGTLTAIYNGVYNQWNNVRIELHSANSYFNTRYNQYISAGHNHNSAMSALLKEPNVWQQSTSTVSKATTLQSSKYGWAFSWFGFVGLNPGNYRVVVPGYPQLSRWVSFNAGGQSLNVELEHR